MRLKDILEKNVDEKYYLPDDRIEKILNSTFIQEKKRIQTTDVCDTLLARDYKDPKCVPVEELNPVRLGGLYDTEDGKHQAGAIWDKDAISPTLDTMQGGNRQPYIVDEIKYRLDELKKETIADADEIMQYFTKVMRGEEKDQFGLDAPLAERTRAAQELAKRVIDSVDNADVTVPEVKITLNWEGM
jgi:hypothetical protein